MLPSKCLDESTPPPWKKAIYATDINIRIKIVVTAENVICIIGNNVRVIFYGNIV